VSDRSAFLAVLGGWSFLAVVVLTLLIGALVRPGYLQVLGLVVVEALLLFWVYTLWGLW
jgi:hypothetical protein